MVQKPIAIMILPVFVAGILMLGILATTGNAQESSNTGNRQHYLPETEENNAHFAQEQASNNHPMCLNEHTEKWEPCVVKNSAQKQENSNTPTQEEKTKGEKTNPENTQGGKVAQENSNNGKAQESSNTGQSSRPATTITSIQVKTKVHTTPTNEQLSENGMLPKLTLAPKPTGPTVAPRVEGAKTIAEVQEAKSKAAQQAASFGLSLEQVNDQSRWFDTKTHTCEGAIISSQLENPGGIMPSNPNIDVTGKAFCKGKVISSPTGTVVHYGPNGKPIEKLVKVEQKAMHPSLTTYNAGGALPLHQEHHGAALASSAGLGGLVKPAGHLAKIVHKVGGETLEAGKALLGIKGK